MGLHVEAWGNLAGCQVDGDGVVEVGAVAAGQFSQRLVESVDVYGLVVDSDNKERGARSGW